MDRTQRGYILLVEDDSDARDAYQLILESAGWSVVGLADGEAALERLFTDGRRVDLVVLDLMMPRMDGPEFHALKRSHAAVADVPVIVMTATPDACPLTDGDDVKAVLRKPVSVPELIEEADRWIDRTGSPS
jgi:CheY-like chemotaxis protein